MKSMKKFVAALLVLTMVLAMTSVAFAYKEKKIGDDDGVLMKFVGSAWGYHKVTNNYGKSKSSVCIRKGSRAFAVAKKGDWYKIRIPARGKEGKFDTLWFNKKYIKKVTADIDVPHIIFGSGGGGRSTKFTELSNCSVLKNKKVKTTGKTNLRSTWCLKGKSLGTVKKGAKVTLTGKWGGDSRYFIFFEVSYNHKKGYISEGYLQNGEKLALKALLNSIPE